MYKLLERKATGPMSFDYETVATVGSLSTALAICNTKEILLQGHMWLPLRMFLQLRIATKDKKLKNVTAFCAVSTLC